MTAILSDNHAEETTSMRDAYVDGLMAAADKNDRVLAIDADLMLSLNLKRFMQKFPERSIDCGVQEANMYGVAAGLSLLGFIPYAHTFACFASRRACDQIFLSGAYARLNIRVVGSDPGITAAFNGGTHMTFEDIGIMRVIPGMTILEPTDATMMRDIVQQLAGVYGMYYLRLIRRPMPKIYADGSTFTIGKAVRLCEGKDVTIIATGICVAEALKAVDLLKPKGIAARVLNMFTLKPIDAEAVVAAAEETGAIVSAENHNIINGLGAAIAETVVRHCPVPMENVGVQDRFGEVGPYDYLIDHFGLTAPYIAEKVEKVLQRKGQKRA
jgi:transketolase